MSYHILFCAIYNAVSKHFLIGLCIMQYGSVLIFSLKYFLYFLAFNGYLMEQVYNFVL